MRIVIAEDTVLLREGLAGLLEDAGHEVVARVGEARVVADHEGVVAGPADVELDPAQTRLRRGDDRLDGVLGEPVDTPPTHAAVPEQRGATAEDAHD